MASLRELMKQKEDLTNEYNQILNRAEKEDRDLTGGEKVTVGQKRAKLEMLNVEIRDLEARQGSMSGLLAGLPDPNLGSDRNGGGNSDGYSILNVIRALEDARLGRAHAYDLVQRELEISEEISSRMGKKPRGVYVPVSQLTMQKRDLTKGVAGDGGNTVATELLATSFITTLQNKMVVRQAGATVLPDLVGDIAIPRQLTGATAAWVDENGAPAESNQTFDQVTMSPKTVGAWVQISRKLLLQSSLAVEQFVRDDLATRLALAIDLAALHGTGANNQPRGIAATAGIGSVVGGAAGLAPTWAHVIGLETEVAVDNADLGRLGYITNTKVRAKLKQTEKIATSGLMVWPEDNAKLNGYPAYVSNQVASNLVKGGSGAVCSAIFFGNWADLFIGMWGVLDILIDPYTGGTSGTVRVIALQDVDIAVRHAESFAAMLDALTA